MELIVFCGLQGAGKTTFYNNHFAATHLRISMDMLKTRRREWGVLDACLRVGQRCVLDNTNPTIAERAPYVAAGHAHNFGVVAYYFDAPVRVCLVRNAARPGKARIPERGIRATAAKLTIPRREEGFTCIYHVSAEGEVRLVTERAT